MNESLKTKKALILAGGPRDRRAKIHACGNRSVARRLIAEHGEEGKTGTDYIAEVLKDAGMKVALSLQEEAEEQYEEEFEDLLHFKTLEDAEVSIMRLDELKRKFQAQGRTRRRRSGFEHCPAWQAPRRNDRAKSQGRAAKTRRKKRNCQLVPYLAGNAGRFFDWLDVRKQSPDFQENFRRRRTGSNECTRKRAARSGALELPPFSLDVEALDLGEDVKAVGLELLETENREPVRGKDAAAIWAAVFPALAGQ